MSTRGLEMLDHTVQLTHEWIDELDKKLGWTNKHRSFRLLRAVLQTLRDCLPLNESADFAAQLPTLLRGMYYSQWRPGQVKSRHWTLDQFLQRLHESFRDDPIEDMADVVSVVFALISEKISAGEIRDVIGCLPAEIRELWLVQADGAARAAPDDAAEFEPRMAKTGGSTMKVKDVMHKGVTWVPPTALLSSIAKKMRKDDIGAIPVGENDRLVGMVTDRDICCRGMGSGRDAKKLTARQVMSKPILYCKAEQDVKAAIRIMKKAKVRRLPVINEKKRMVGMLSLGDISAKSTRAASGMALKALAAHHA